MAKKMVPIEEEGQLINYTAINEGGEPALSLVGSKKVGEHSRM